MYLRYIYTIFSKGGGETVAGGGQCPLPRPLNETLIFIQTPILTASMFPASAVEMPVQP